MRRKLKNRTKKKYKFWELNELFHGLSDGARWVFADLNCLSISWSRDSWVVNSRWFLFLVYWGWLYSNCAVEIKICRKYTVKVTPHDDVNDFFFFAYWLTGGFFVLMTNFLFSLRGRWGDLKSEFLVVFNDGNFS